MKNKKLPFAALLAIGLFCISLAAGAAEKSKGTDFDHLRTGFPLTGAHTNVECQTCHVRGVFKGTPRECAICHSPSRGIASTAKPANHIPTTLPCEQCHAATATWAGARFSHTGVAPGTCGTCHNSRIASGKPANHVATSAPCDSCHRTTAWVPARGFDHTGVTPGTCGTCHNGTRATGKGSRHIPTTAACDQCHRTSSWIPTLGNTAVHTGVAPGSCGTCHNGSYNGAAPKPGNHIPTTAACDQCHRTTAWVPTLGNTAVHTGVAPGSCGTCHNGSFPGAAGKPGNHLPTTASCDSCHRTTAWIPASAFNHTGVTPGTCGTCHNGTTATGKNTRHIPTTAACDQCHRTSSWIPTLGNTAVHTGVAPGSCGTCHNGSYNGAVAKPANHVITTAPCDSCHRTTAWIPATFSHASVAPGTCGTCHNGTTATGKNARHIPTTAACDQCHRTTTWVPTLGASAVHTGIIPGQCGTCHNGSYQGAVGKTPTHVPTTQSCDVCHRTTAWIPAGFDHSGVAPGGCLTCHSNDKPTGHFVTTRSCDACHTIPTGTIPTGLWPVRYTSHISPYYAPHSSAVNNNCKGCHGTPETETIGSLVRYSPPPTCAGCHTHSNKFKSGPHDKTETPATKYTAVELHNCSGACHYYLTTVGGALKESRPGPRHTTTNGRW